MPQEMGEGECWLTHVFREREREEGKKERSWVLTHVVRLSKQLSVLHLHYSIRPTGDRSPCCHPHHLARHHCVGGLQGQREKERDWCQICTHAHTHANLQTETHMHTHTANISVEYSRRPGVPKPILISKSCLITSKK